MSSRRLKKELNDILDKYDIEETEKDDLCRWQIALHGPEDSPYFGGTFILVFSFSKDYPFEAPDVQFQTKIYHPNIDHRGNICLSVIKDGWKPANTVSFILKSIEDLLKTPKPKDPLNVEAAKLYLENKDEYNRRTAEITHKYAIIAEDL